MAETYNPLQHSVVQACVGAWEHYECDDYVEALLMAILAEIKRVHWNVYQHSWGPSWHADEIEDPEIPGIVFTRYYDGCPCEDEDEHRPECRHVRPNFQHEDVQFRWYKYPGRGMSTNKNWTAEEWRAWFGRCLATVRALEGDDHFGEANRKRQEDLRSSLRARFPSAFEVSQPKADREAMSAFFNWMDWLEHAQTPCWKCSEDGWGSGGGTYESGPAGTIARTLHEDDDPEGACRNCGHINTDEQTAALEERRRVNSDAARLQWSKKPPSTNAVDPTEGSDNGPTPREA